MAYSFSFDSGDGSTNFRGFNLVKSPGQNAVQKIRTPNVPVDNRGELGQNSIVVTQMGLDVGGYNGTATIRYVVYENSGTYVFRTESASVPNKQSTVDLPRVNIDCNPDGVEKGSTILSGGETYGFGVWSVGPIGFQKQVNSSSNVFRDTSIGIGDNMSYGTLSEDVDRTLIGKVFYYYLPSAPKNLTVTIVGSTSTLAWDSPSDDGGTSITGYSIAYKPTTSATWLYIDTRTLSSSTTKSYTFNGLTGTYNFKVAAYNKASIPLGAVYDGGTDATSKYSAETSGDGTTPSVAALGPAVRIPTDPPRWTNSKIHVYQSATVNVSSSAIQLTTHGLAIGAEIIFSGTLPPGLSYATTYYVIATNFTTNSFKISNTPNGVALVITDATGITAKFWRVCKSFYVRNATAWQSTVGV
jgi:hypothetical protein